MAVGCDRAVLVEGVAACSGYFLGVALGVPVRDDRIAGGVHGDEWARQATSRLVVRADGRSGGDVGGGNAVTPALSATSSSEPVYCMPWFPKGLPPNCCLPSFVE